MKKIYSHPCTGKYLVRNMMANKILTLTDNALSLFRPLFMRQQHTVKEPRSLLICNTAHLGDVVMTTAILAAIKKKYPHCKIGLLIGSWSQPLVEEHPFVDQLHLLDHWKVNRSSLSLARKYAHYRQQFQKVLQEIRREKYEAAFDLNYHFPSSPYLLYRSQIPYTTGYDTAGLTPLYSHPQKWVYDPETSSVEYGAQLFKDILPLNKEDLHTSLASRSSFAKLGSPLGIHPKGYIVAHIGSGSPHKDWPLVSWITLLNRLKGYPIILTGRGDKDLQMAVALHAAIPTLINHVNAVTLSELICLIQNAKLLFSLDTMAGHIASAVGTPCISLYTGIQPLNQWRPWGHQGAIFTAKTACSPCYNNKGCATMECLRSINPDDVYEAAKAFLSQDRYNSTH